MDLYGHACSLTCDGRGLSDSEILDEWNIQQDRQREDQDHGAQEQQEAASGPFPVVSFFRIVIYGLFLLCHCLSCRLDVEANVCKKAECAIERDLVLSLYPDFSKR